MPMITAATAALGARIVSSSSIAPELEVDFSGQINTIWLVTKTILLSGAKRRRAPAAQL